MLSHRLRRRPSLKPMLVQPRVFLVEKNWDAHREILLQYGPVCIPIKTRHWPSAVLMLVQYLRRWPNINPALGQCLLFTGKSVSIRPPNKHGSLTTCWFKAGSSSTTLAQHWTSTWWMFRVYWELLPCYLSAPVTDADLLCERIRTIRTLSIWGSWREGEPGEVRRRGQSSAGLITPPCARTHTAVTRCTSVRRTSHT